MTKPIIECEYTEQLLRALIAIDGLCMCDCEPPEDERALSAVYRIAHSVTRHCGNKHEDWLASIDETFEALDKSNTLRGVDTEVEKLLKANVRE